MELTKGLKVFERPVARTDAEIWLKIREANQSPLASSDPLRSSSVIEHPKTTRDDRIQAYFSKMHRQYGEYDYFEFHYDVENIRIARSEQRDLLQDLRDAAEGIEVVHNIDQIKAQAEKKRAAKQHRRELKVRRAQKAALPQPQTDEQFSLFTADTPSSASEDGLGVA